MKTMPDQNVPDWLLTRAYGIAVVPDVVEARPGAGRPARQGRAGYPQ